MIVPTVDGNPGSANVCSPECAELYEEMCLLRSRCSCLLPLISQSFDEEIYRTAQVR